MQFEFSFLKAIKLYTKMKKSDKESKLIEVVAFIRPTLRKDSLPASDSLPTAVPVIPPPVQLMARTFMASKSRTRSSARPEPKSTFKRTKLPIAPANFRSRQRSMPGISLANRILRTRDGRADKENQNVFASKMSFERKGVPCVKRLTCKVPTAPRIRRYSMQKTFAAQSMTRSAVQSNYEIGRQIGRGAYAIVKEALNKVDGVKYAAKIYDKHQLANEQKRKNVQNEVSILRKLSHENIVKLYEVLDFPKQTVLILELIHGRSLYSHLKKQVTRRLEESEVKRLLCQLLSALAYCHTHNISHRDIKLDNILIDPYTSHLTLIDFGFSAHSHSNEKLATFCGTPSYMAPEIVSRREYRGQPADMWAVGVLLYTLLCGAHPFRGDGEKELFRRIAAGVYSAPQGASEEMKELVGRMLQVDPAKRVTSEEALRDRLFVRREKVVQADTGYAELYKKYGRTIINKIVSAFILL